MSLLESLGQSDIEEVAVELVAGDLAPFGQRRKYLLFKRARQVTNEVQDLALQNIDAAVDDARPGPARILFQERLDLAALFDHPPVARGVGDLPQRERRRGAGSPRGPLEGAQIDVEESVSVHEQKMRIERVARDRQRSGGAERNRLAHHPHRGLADPAAAVSRLDRLPEMTGEQDDVPVAVALDHLQKIVKERPIPRDWQHRLRHGAGDCAEPRALAADQDHRLPDRLAAHCFSAFDLWLFACRPQTRSASAAARKT